MRRYTTPTITLTVSGIDLSDYDVYVTFKQKNVLITKSDEDVTVSYDSEDDVTTISVYLTQSETAQFDAKYECKAQINWITSSGVRKATKIKPISIESNLLNEEIDYGD